MEHPYISVSRIRCYLSCSLKYYFRYELKLPSPMNGALLIGKAVHSSVEAALRLKAERKIDMPIDTLMDVYSQNFHQLLLTDNIDLEGKERSDLKDTGYGLTKLFGKEILPKKNPAFIEHEFNLSFENVPYVFKGFIDEISEDGVLSDLKTAAKSWSEDSILTDMQLSGYCLAYKHIFGKLPKGLRLDILIKTKTPKTQILTCGPRDERILERFLRIMGNTVALIDSKIFVPSESVFNCSTCDYGEECRKF
ncbi:MAG: hypothetical protein A2252_09680 [Elusimicrobia bacterium RIFOXYA2_FULL_39_19]|nr:MAG: hypothetical protein A2252_09680 [Elusimicrobia bacterium RIFOXYA2_FULL_39_19]